VGGKKGKIKERRTEVIEVEASSLAAGVAFAALVCE
jgi:hypothetical protein